MLKTVDLLKRFGGNNLVLDGVSVAFDETSVTAITGLFGSGKTTLLYCLSDVLCVTPGRVFLDGVDITGLGRRRLDVLRGTSFGFISQDYDLIDALIAIQNVRLPSLFGGAGATKPRTRGMLVLVGLSGLENQYPTELSGNQRQQVAIARMLAAEHRVVSADKLTGALNSASRWEVLGRFAALPALGSIATAVTHDPTAIAAALRALFLYNGVIMDDHSGPGARDIAARLTDLEARS